MFTPRHKNSGGGVVSKLSALVPHNLFLFPKDTILLVQGSNSEPAIYTFKNVFVSVKKKVFVSVKKTFSSRWKKKRFRLGEKTFSSRWKKTVFVSVKKNRFRLGKKTFLSRCLCFTPPPAPYFGLRWTLPIYGHFTAVTVSRIQMHRNVKQRRLTYDGHIR